MATKWTEDMKQELISCQGEADIRSFADKHNLSYENASRRRRKLVGSDNLSAEVKADRLIARQKAEIQTLKKKNAHLMKEADINEVMLQLVKESIETLPVVHAPREVKRDTKLVVEESILDWSDAHLDEHVSAEQLGGLNEYGFVPFCKRLEEMSDSIISIHDKMQGYSLKKLHIFALGDMVSGLIHAELVKHADLNPYEAIMNGAIVSGQFLMELLSVYDEIEFTGVVGNHGRMTEKKEYKDNYVNWDYFFYQILALMMANNPRIKFDLPKSFWTIKVVGGRKQLLLHGDNIKSWNGIPWYGIDRAVKRLYQLLHTQGSFDDVHMGHFHNTGTLDTITGEMFINGSMVGGNEFSIGALFASSAPKQLFMGVNPAKQRITWRFPLDLSDGDLKETTRYRFSETVVVAEQVREMFL